MEMLPGFRELPFAHALYVCSFIVASFQYFTFLQERILQNLLRLFKA